MANPFPGVDPFIEDQHLWPDFHITFITEWREALRKTLPNNYVARLDERVRVIEYSEQSSRLIEPDIAIAKRDTQSFRAPTEESSVALLEPVVIAIPFEEEKREAYIKILHCPDMTLVGVLEVLSPSNKEDPGRAAYRAKRNELLNRAVHLIELDLLIGGERLPLKKPYPPGQFFALVARADCRPDCHVYHWSLRNPLPTIPIPLLPDDGEISIDLAQVYASTLERGDYSFSIDYNRSLRMQLSDRDSAWVKDRTAQFIK